MRMEKFTSSLQQALSDAQSLALGKDHNQIDTVHLLLSLLDQKQGGIKPLLQAVGIQANQLKMKLADKLQNLPTVASPDGNLSVSTELGRILNLTDRLAQKRGDQYISSDLVLLAAVEDKGEAGKVLKELGITKDKLEQAIDTVRGGESVNDPNAEDNRQALDKR